MEVTEPTELQVRLAPLVLRVLTEQTEVTEPQVQQALQVQLVLPVLME